MHDSDENDCEAEAVEPVARPWSWMQLLAFTANFAANLNKAGWAFFDDIKDAAQGHVAVGDDTRDAWKSLHRDLESLPTTDQ